MKKTLIALALAFPALAQAQTATNGVDIPLFSGYDLASTSYIYCATYGDSTGYAKEQWKKGPNTVVTTAASSTVTSTVAGIQAFNSAAVGDEVRIQVNGVFVYRRITARAS